MACEYFKSCPEYDFSLEKCSDAGLPCKRYDEFMMKYDEIRANTGIRSGINCKSFEKNLEDKIK